MRILLGLLVALLELLWGLLSFVNGIWWLVTPWRWSDSGQHHPTALDYAISRLTIWQMHIFLDWFPAWRKKR